MSSIQSQPLTAVPSYPQSTLSDSQFSHYVKKQSFSAYESLDAGLTIKTREGDLVTLSSNTYSKLDAFLYNSKGILQTDAGKVAVTETQREITLASGESFTFSIAGDLNEQELKDVEAIVKGIDGVISEMAQGNMNDAVATALSMGGYDSIAAYAADITYEKSYAMTSEIEADQRGVAPETAVTPDEFFEKMAEMIKQLDEKLADKAQKPIEKLFGHHLGNMKGNSSGEDGSLYNEIENAGKKIDKLIEKITAGIFKDQLSAFLG